MIKQKLAITITKMISITRISLTPSYIVWSWSWPWQILGVIYAEARVGERAKILFFLSSK